MINEANVHPRLAATPTTNPVEAVTPPGAACSSCWFIVHMFDGENSWEACKSIDFSVQGQALREMIWKRHTKLKLLTLVAVLIVLIAAGYLMWGGRAFTARNLAAEQKFEELIQSSPGKDQLLEKLHPAGFRVSTWGKPPDEYYVVYRQVETPFDLLSDRYYMYTNRGSRRLTGLLFFGADDQVTSYTISSQPGSKYAEKAP